MVAYAMRITDLNPLNHDLIFERFLNPDRVSMPDFDVDFDDRRRPEVIDYVTEKYGEDKVAQIVTFGTIKAKQALKDASRVMDQPYSVGERLTKAMPPDVMGKNIALANVYNPEDKRYSEAGDLRALIEDPVDKIYGEVFETAKGLEGLKRQWGVHAAGVIMSSKNLTDVIPVMRREADGQVITQFDYPTCEGLGLIKMDFLGLRNLTIISDALDNVKMNRGIEIDLENLEVDDKESYRLLARGDTLGVFQLDGGPMRSLLKLMEPEEFEHISAVLALYRPGPMGANSHTNYALRKNGKQEIQPIHPELEEPLAEILDTTYGLIVYQEQVQSAARILAGYSLGRADVLRRAMGKKKPEVLAKEKVPFFEGMEEHGYSQEAAQAVWDVLVPFAGYAFNKAHSAAYGLISYWTAYLKAHYPVEFMAALLQGEHSNKDKTALYLGECRRMNIRVLPPDVNESVDHYSAVGDDIRFGLGAVRNVGTKIVESIVEERERADGKGKFAGFLDWVDRMPVSTLNKRTVESLIKSGAFDSIDPNRRALFTVHESAIDQVIPLKRKEAEGQFDLFADADGAGSAASAAMGDASISVPSIDEWDKKTKLNFEREMLGLYVSDHPLSGLAAVLSSLSDMSIPQLLNRASDMPERSQITIAGLVTGVDRRVSKAGKPWALVTIEDLESSIQCLFFSKSYTENQDKLIIDSIVQVRGSVSVRDDGVSIYGREVEIPNVDSVDVQPVQISLPARALEQGRLQRLSAVLAHHPGYCEVSMAVIQPDRKTEVIRFGDKYRVTRDTSLFGELKSIFGPRCIEA